MKNKRLLFFHPKLQYPSIGGSDVHTHEIIQSLMTLGYEVILFLIDTKKRPILNLENWPVEKLIVHPFSDDRKNLKEAFDKALNKVDPAYVWINYPSWDFILDHQKNVHRYRILYNHHFESVRKKMSALYNDLWNLNPPKSLKRIHPDLYRLDFFDENKIRPDSKEHEVSDQYHLVFAIQDQSFAFLQKHCKKAKVVSLKVTLKDPQTQNKPMDHALLTMSPYNFNFQGYYFFVKNVLPIIVKKAPLFRVRLTGLGSEYFLPSSHVVCKRYVENIKEEYEKARLCLCPAFAGTGQQVKIVESMFHKVPVVSMHNPWQYNPIENAVNGYIAQSAEQFASYVLDLYLHPNKAKEMGQRAYETACQYFSRPTLIQSLQEIERLSNLKTV